MAQQADLYLTPMYPFLQCRLCERTWAVGEGFQKPGNTLRQDALLLDGRHRYFTHGLLLPGPNIRHRESIHPAEQDLQDTQDDPVFPLDRESNQLPQLHPPRYSDSLHHSNYPLECLHLFPNIGESGIWKRHLGLPRTHR